MKASIKNVVIAGFVSIAAAAFMGCADTETTEAYNPPGQVVHVPTAVTNVPPRSKKIYHHCWPSGRRCKRLQVNTVRLEPQLSLFGANLAFLRTRFVALHTQRSSEYV